MPLHIHDYLLCSAERAAIARKAEQRRRTVDTIILSLTVLTLGIGLGTICALADLPHSLVFIALVLWSVWAMRLIFMRPHMPPRALRERMLTPDAVNQVTTVTPVNQCQSVPVRDQSVKS